MVHVEHLRKADESIEIYIGDNDINNVVYCYFKDGECILFRSLDDFINYVYLANPLIERVYLDEKQWEDEFKNTDLDLNFDTLKEKYK